MNYQSKAYSYNQRSEIVIPNRRGTTYYGSQNHKPLIAYDGVTNDFEFFVIDNSRKPVSLANKTFKASVVNRTTKTAIITKTLVTLSTDTGSVLMRLTESDLGKLSPALYDVTITYTDNEAMVFGLYSDQNARLTYVLEVKANTATTITPSQDDESLTGDTDTTNNFTGTAQSQNSDGTNTVVAYTTNFSGKFYAEGSLEQSPTEAVGDWFTIQLNPGDAEDYWTFTGATGLEPFTFDGMFMWVRFRYVAAVGNEGTLDKVLYRS
jgi:hypothetical protein